MRWQKAGAFLVLQPKRKKENIPCRSAPRIQRTLPNDPILIPRARAQGSVLPVRPFVPPHEGQRDRSQLIGSDNALQKGARDECTMTPSHAPTRGMRLSRMERATADQ